MHFFSLPQVLVCLLFKISARWLLKTLTPFVFKLLNIQVSSIYFIFQSKGALIPQWQKEPQKSRTVYLKPVLLATQYCNLFR